MSGSRESKVWRDLAKAESARGADPGLFHAAPSPRQAVTAERPIDCANKNGPPEGAVGPRL